MSNATEWTCQDVGEWLRTAGFGAYEHLFCEQHRIDGIALLSLNENDLCQHPLQMDILGDRKHLMFELRNLQTANMSALLTLGIDTSTQVMPDRPSRPSDTIRPPRLGPSVSTDGGDGDESISHTLQPEYLKLVISYAYMFTVFWLTSFTMVIVHDRVPDMAKYPPLPDLFLDNMPYVPWAFDMCECTAVILGCITAGMLFFHKYRFIILRRFFAMMGTVFMLRCITMLITSLSVPGKHLACKPMSYGDIWSKFDRTFQIWRGFGMSLQGVRTCGDYMFSGHTVVITMLNFFNTEYISRRFHYFHTASWVMNIFGIFFILAAHEHYSIDVFIAFYITSRLFLYYHSLANNSVLQQGDHRRMRIWFPLFSYFESGIDGIVPNAYEWPLSWPTMMWWKCMCKAKSN